MGEGPTKRRVEAPTEAGALWAFRAQYHEELTAEENRLLAEVATELEAAPTDKPTREQWFYRPLDQRGKMPRRKRHKFRDPLTGDLVHIYADTLKPHRDPECPCRLCRNEDPMKADNTITILDLATTGTDPQKDKILEVCCLLVDADNYEVLDTYTEIVAHPPGSLENVFKPHVELVQLCATDGVPISRIEGEMLAGPWNSAKAVCNRALDFDLAFLRQHMPAFAAGLPRRKIDLKDLQVALEAGRGEFKPVEIRSYRAPDDAIEAYRELCHWSGIVEAS